MANSIIQTAAIPIANAIKALLVGGEIHLWIDGMLTPGPNVTPDQLSAAECNFSGYALVSMPATLNVYGLPYGGAAIEIPGLYFVATSASPFVSNMVGGWWIYNDGTGDIAVGSFDNPIPILRPGDAVPTSLVLPVAVPSS